MKTKKLTTMAILLTLLIICSQFSIPLPPTPITLQTFAVLLIGMLLPPKLAFYVTLTYLVAGLVGLPVFSSLSGGLKTILSPSFGFIISFIPASVATALYLQRTKQPTLIHFFIAGLIATAIIYLIGVGYIAIILTQVIGAPYTFIQLLMLGMIPFLIGDMLKLVLASFIAKRLQSTSRLK